MNSSSKFKTAFINSLASSYVIQFSIMLISFVSQLVLARLLSAEHFGLFAQAMFINMLFADLVNFGFSKHLIRSDYSRWGNAFLIQGVLVALIVTVFNLWPGITDPYEPMLKDIMKVFIYYQVFVAINNNYSTYLLKNLNVSKMIIPNVAGTVLYVAIVVWMGFRGWNEWALVWATLISELFKTALFTAAFGRELLKKLTFTFKYSKELIYGSVFLFLLAITGDLHNQIDRALLGSLLTPAFVGMFFLANKFIQFPEKIISRAVRQILFPAFTASKDNPERTQKLIKYSTLTIVAAQVFIYGTIFVYADLIVNTVIGEKWHDLVPLLRMMCFMPIFFPYGKYAEYLLTAHKYEKWNFAALVFNILISIALGLLLIPKFRNEGMVMVRYVNNLVTIIPILITIKKLGIRLFYREYFIVYLPLLVCPMILLPIGPRLMLLPVIILYFIFIFVIEYRLIISKFMTFEEIKERIGMKRA